MARYRFQQTYKSSYGAGTEGDEVELTDEQAHDINRDAPGTLAPVEADTRAPDAPAHDRQVKRAPQKRAVTHE